MTRGFLALLLLAMSAPVQAETIHLVIKSTLQGKGISLLAIPMASAKQCEEEGVLLTTSERFDIRFANQDAFECVKGK
jgi:hypothetical protein